VGAAVGAAGGALVTVLIAFLLWRYCRRPKSDLIPIVPELGSTEVCYLDRKEVLLSGSGFSKRPVY
jgi:hypothetical protein